MKNTKFFAGFIEDRIKKKLDSISIVESGSVKGTGKTVFTTDISKDLCNTLGITWNLKKMLMMNATTDKLIHEVKYQPFGFPVPVDEAIFLAYKRDYSEDPVKNLVKFLNICRKFKKPVFLNSPSFWDLDRDVRALCDFRITVVKRGIACVRGKYTNPEYEDLWLREESKEVIDKEIGSDMTDLNGVIRGINKCRNHLFDIIFPDMPKDEYAEYEKLSMAQEGQQIALDEKKVYVMMKVIVHYILTQCFFKLSSGAFSKVTSGTLSRVINDEIAHSKYAVEMSKFRMGRGAISDYKRAWRESIEGRVSDCSADINNINITNREEEDKEAETDKEPFSAPLLEDVA